MRSPQHHSAGEHIRTDHAATDHARSLTPRRAPGTLVSRTSQGTIVRPPLASSGASPSALQNFGFIVEGTQAFVRGGYWRIDGFGEGHTDKQVLDLSGSEVYLWVRCPVDSISAEIGFSNVRPSATDAAYHYRVLCKCVAYTATDSDGHSVTKYSVVEWGWVGGDIAEAAPLP